MTRPKTEDEFVQNLKRIWESFEVKDLTLPEFIRQMKDLHDPTKMFEDLGEIELAKARARMTKMRIDRACEN